MNRLTLSTERRVVIFTASALAAGIGSVAVQTLGIRGSSMNQAFEYWLASPKLKVKAAEIHPAVLGSDHCPVSIEI